MLRGLVVLPFVLPLVAITCAGPSTQVPADEIQQAVVADAVALGERCGELNDLTELAWSWAQVCWHRTAPELDRATAALEGCRAQGRERGLEAAGRHPAGIDLSAPFVLDQNCPADPPNDIAQLQVYADIDYGVEDGPTIDVVLTNFCDDEIEYGFAPPDDKPPIVMQLPALTRRTITIPRSYGLRGRLAHADAQWEPGMCTAKRSGMFLTFAADCRSCISDGVDPLRRADCVEAGSCPRPGAR